MYSNYLYDDRDAFKDLYVDVTDEVPSPAIETSLPLPASSHPKSENLISSLFSRFSGGENNLVTILILLFLLFDSDDDEKFIILALALLMGI